MCERQLESEYLRMEFDQGRLTTLINQLTGQVYAVQETGPRFESSEFTEDSSSLSDPLVETRPGELLFRYESAEATWTVAWRLGPHRHFAEKIVTWIPRRDVDLLRVTIAEFALKKPTTEIVCVKHPTFGRIEHPGLTREPDTEPVKTYFIRTPAGGLFLGLEMPFDRSAAQNGSVHLQFAPHLKLSAGSRFECEAAYVGVYQRSPSDHRAQEWRPSDAPPPPDGLPLPLPSESLAMTAMTSALLGPPRHGVKAFACGWHSEMEQGEVTSDAVKAECASLDRLKACGLDGATDSHPWGGETAKMNALVEGDRYVLSPPVKAILKYAQSIGLSVSQWSTMNQSHPWIPSGRPFRPDRPEWLRGVSGTPLDGINADHFKDRAGNCLACTPFYQWLESIIRQAMDTGYYDSWAIDGDFWGTGAYYHTTIPVTCLAHNHDHLPGDSNYACQRTLNRLLATLRQAYPTTYIVTCRPPMDLGVWSNRHADACFTLIESGTGADNIKAGDEIRTASRIRVHHHFFPHWLDWALLFPSYAGYGSYAQNPAQRPPWPSHHLDYILLSALSCTPNLLMYLPTQTGIPEADQAEIRKWLDWARVNERFLKVRHDLFDWPGPGRVDGSIHWIDEEGLIFLFNPSDQEQSLSIDLFAEIRGRSTFESLNVYQEYPLQQRPPHQVLRGKSLKWSVLAKSACILRLKKRHRGC